MEHEILNNIVNIRGKTMKRHGSVPEYHYVRIVSFDGEKTYRAELPKIGQAKNFAVARDAAIHIDKMLLSVGKDPINVLRKK